MIANQSITAISDVRPVFGMDITDIRRCSGRVLISIAEQYCDLRMLYILEIFHQAATTSIMAVSPLIPAPSVQLSGQLSGRKLESALPVLSDAPRSMGAGVDLAEQMNEDEKRKYVKGAQKKQK